MSESMRSNFNEGNLKSLSNVELTRIALNWLAAIKGKGQSDWALASQRSGTSGRWHNAEAAVNHGRVAMP
ncbi:hypothetical protein T07_12449 [Trichinella nelsoni]|uniref:Uncharacterized protein n=2 Tax=Trichinella TaxID=6333 RepID=A0A0V1AAB8_9BILA|nr:hypothetical protein T07_12449 [Trichinella nelsoni]KRY21725.1 hypothetical protein T12_12916 [Trichinella patagoniensis]